MCLDRGVITGSSRASGAVVCSDGGHSESLGEVGRQISFCSVGYASRKALLLRSSASSSDFGKKQRLISGATEYAQEISDSMARSSPSEGRGTDSPKLTSVDYLDGHFHKQFKIFSDRSPDSERSMVYREEQAPYKLSGVAGNWDSNCGTEFKAGFRFFLLQTM